MAQIPQPATLFEPGYLDFSRRRTFRSVMRKTGAERRSHLRDYLERADLLR